jgi:pimeloyl-ACP methyl ester carboxylesterase
VKLHCEDRSAGPAVLFVHEYGGSCRSFDVQVEAFRARHRCVVFNARGYPPSEVPASVGSYSQYHALADIGAVLDGLGIEKVHLVGASMGAASALQFALKQPGRVLSATLVGIGSGSDDPALFRQSAEANAKQIETGGMRAFAEQMGRNPNRIRMMEKDPAEFRRSLEGLSRMSPVGHANTMRGVQAGRPPLYADEKRLALFRVPVLVVVGEEDAGCRKPSEFLERVLPDARLVVVPKTGHAVNQEEPAEFNRLCLAFIEAVTVAGA